MSCFHSDLIAMIGLLAWASGSIAFATGAPGIRLTGEQWTVEVGPATLAIVGHFPDGEQLRVSLGTPGLGSAGYVSQVGGRASWELPEPGLRVEASFDRDRLNIQIAASQPGKFTWPVMGADPRMAGLILPLGEGFYVPMAEKKWRDFVTGESPFHTMADLTMPLWALDYGGRSLTYILTNPMDNSLFVEPNGERLALRLTHEFQRNSPEKQYGLLVVPGGASPIEPAQIFRKWLVENGQFVDLRGKLQQLPDVEKLLGAAHVYLWAAGVMDLEDVQDWPGFVAALRRPRDHRAERIASLLPAETRSALGDSAKERVPSRYLKAQVLIGLNEIIQRRDLYESALWPAASLPAFARELGEKAPGELSDSETVRLNGPLLNLAFPHLLEDSASFGGGISPKMIRRLKKAGLDRLWLGVSDLNVLHYLPETVAAAKEAGFLFGPYDSYHSIHSPGTKQTWPTAQFDQKLYDEGAIVQANGQRDRGFLGTGSHLSSAAAEPYAQQRVAAWMKEFGFNSYFVDCDATGEVFDNYSPRYPATKQLDMELRLKRMAWIRDTYHAVVGSEIGAYYSAPVIHFGHGMMTPVFGFRDPLLHDAKSPYFLGRWYPEGAPDVFLKQTILPAKYKEIYFDETHRLPLYQAAFHDAIVTTHHWSAASLKFNNVLRVNELLELLYGIPPLYHLDLAEWERHKEEIQNHYRFFSPNYRILGLLPLSEFTWLTPDREVQETRFGDEAVVVANFGDKPYAYLGHAVPAASVLLLLKKTGKILVYTSQYGR